MKTERICSITPNEFIENFDKLTFIPLDVDMQTRGVKRCVIKWKPNEKFDLAEDVSTVTVQGNDCMILDRKDVYNMKSISTGNMDKYIHSLLEEVKNDTESTVSISFNQSKFFKHANWEVSIGSRFVKLYRNDELFAEKGPLEINEDNCFQKAQEMLYFYEYAYEHTDCSIDFNKYGWFSTLQNRKVWFNDEPAIITEILTNRNGIPFAKVKLEPDTAFIKHFSPRNKDIHEFADSSMDAKKYMEYAKDFANDNPIIVSLDYKGLDLVRLDDDDLEESIKIMDRFGRFLYKNTKRV